MGSIKDITRRILYFFKRKPYKINLSNSLTSYSLCNSDNEYFYGYYDRSPENNGLILYHEMLLDESAVRITVMDIATKKRHVIAESKAYNWQMGSRAVWIDNDTISYNDFDGRKYVCIWYSLKSKSTIRKFDLPLQDIRKKDFYLGVNYQRLRSYAKEYAYYCLPEMSEQEYEDYSNDGIWYMNTLSTQGSLLLSISDIMKCEPNSLFNVGKHFVNHVMISPSGKGFIFIHRYYVKDKRYDRLMHYDFNSLKCLMDEPCQSHYCWLDDKTVFGYGEYEGKKGFYEIDVDSANVKKHTALTLKHPRDGHPTVYHDWIVVDDYPDLSRMQALTAYNYKTNQIIPLGEFFHDLRHKGINRCDLHPRFSDNGDFIYIDTIYSGHRCLLPLNIRLDY